MKTIHFIRHSKLASPYSDYSKLSFEQISNLATGSLQPSISSTSITLLKESFLTKSHIEFQSIIHGTATRSRETAELIKKSLLLDVPIRETQLLNEISFDPRLLTSQEKFLENGMTEIRTSLFEGMMSGKGAESIEDIYIRIKALTNYLQSQPESSIVCITHSFFMRVLRLYFLENKKVKHVNPELLLRTHDHSYLDGFTIKL